MESRDTDFYHKLMERSRHKLKALNISCASIGSLPYYEGVEALTRGIFDHHESTYERHPLLLSDLHMCMQALGSPDRTWFRYVDFAKLQCLHLYNCEGMTSFLHGLTNLARRQRLQFRGLVISATDISDEKVDPLAVQKFLGLISGLKYLNLKISRLESECYFDVGCLTAHAETLQDLYIGVGSDHQDHSALWVPSPADIDWVAANCRRLKQLALALPHERMASLATGRWDDYAIYLRRLTVLPKLKILRILTWPVDCNPKRSTNMRHHQIKHEYLAKLEVVADTIARIFAGACTKQQDRLSVITFGSAEWTDFVKAEHRPPQSIEQPITYKIRRSDSKFGFLMRAQRVHCHDMQYEEPIAYVFGEDTDQGLSLESYPTWGA